MPIEELLLSIGWRDTSERKRNKMVSAMFKKFLTILMLISLSQPLWAEDVIDECPDNPNKTEPGFCGCDFADVDMDRDGILDCIDPVTKRILTPSTKPLPAVLEQKDDTLTVYFEEFDRVRFGKKKVRGLSGRRSYFYKVRIEISNTYHDPSVIYAKTANKIVKIRKRSKNYFKIKNLSAQKYTISYRVKLTKGNRVLATSRRSRKVELDYQFIQD